MRRYREGGGKASRVSMNHSACAMASASDWLSMFMGTMAPVCPCTMAGELELGAVDLGHVWCTSAVTNVAVVGDN